MKHHPFKTSGIRIGRQPSPLVVLEENHDLIIKKETLEEVRAQAKALKMPSTRTKHLLMDIYVKKPSFVNLAFI